MQRKGNRGLGLLCLASMAIWAITLLISDAALEYKLMVGFRDLVVLGVASLLINWAKENLALAIGLSIGILFFLNQIYLPVLKGTFAKVPATINEVDSNAELILDLKPEKREALQQFAESHHLTLVQMLQPAYPDQTTLDEWYTLDVPKDSKLSLEGVMKDLVSKGLVDWVELNEMIQLSPIESDQKAISDNYKTGYFGVNDPDATKLWSFEVLKVPELHKMLKSPLMQPKKKSLIAVLDTGVDGAHEDLTDNFVSTADSYNRDVQGHGTHVAGIIGAVTNNNVGIASMTTDARFFSITSIKVLSDFGFGTQAGIIKGMIEAADLGADVISMSLGGPSNEEKQNAYTEAVAYCLDKGSIVVVAAGNSSANAKSFTPANVDGVIAVSAIDENLSKASFSNTIQDLKMGIAAPGDNIYSTFPKNKYKSQRGTSMAAPFVSSVLGLMRAMDPDITAKEAYKILEGTGISSKDAKETGKIIQPSAALQSLLD